MRRTSDSARIAKLAGQVCIWLMRLLGDAGSGVDAEHQEDRRVPEPGKVGVHAGERGSRDREKPAGDPGGRHAEKFGHKAARGADEERYRYTRQSLA